ncbi:MAG: tyrosine-protein phosphatase, partial [Clostridia bacterium]|nr:tyrosine-protein phosphatase [Clostridia bacterium]
FESGVSGFSTSSAAPRNLNIEGVSNVRDVGGWIIDGSHRVKQGVVYRGAAFEDDQYGTHITEEGVRRAREELGIKTEIELRWITQKEIKSRSESLLGGDVNYYEFEFSYNDEELLEGNAKSIARCFRTIANEKKHPVYYHCRIGTDRTGVLTYLLLGFLGVEKETLLRDYLFSNFGYVGGNRSVDSIKKAYIDIIDS